MHGVGSVLNFTEESKVFTDSMQLVQALKLAIARSSRQAKYLDRMNEEGLYNNNPMMFLHSILKLHWQCGGCTCRKRRWVRT